MAIIEDHGQTIRWGLLGNSSMSVDQRAYALPGAGRPGPVLALRRVLQLHARNFHQDIGDHGLLTRN